MEVDSNSTVTVVDPPGILGQHLWPHLIQFLNCEIYCL
jgi:hypothetical protein